jgi:hypothetical protein
MFIIYTINLLVGQSHKLIVLSLMLSTACNSFSSDAAPGVEVVSRNLDPAAQYALFSGSQLKKLARNSYIKTCKIYSAVLTACKNHCGGGTEAELIIYLGYSSR